MREQTRFGRERADHGFSELSNLSYYSHGFHETCLLQSVCELAKHPFYEDRQNLITDILTFVLTPSLHEGFASSEQIYRDSYEDAERSGFLGEDCSFLYPECALDLLSNISKIISQ